MSALELRFSKAKAAFKGTAAFVAFSLCAGMFYLAFAWHKEVVALPMMVALPIAGWGVITSVKRVRAEGPALECCAQGVVLNKVFNRSSPIRFDLIERVDCDRADRVAYVGGPFGSRGSFESDYHIGDNATVGQKLGGRIGAAFRWGFQIVYRDAVGERRGLRLFDNDVEGGKAALIAFADCINSERATTPVTCQAADGRGLHI